jgi:hypothetical protein
MASSIDLSGLSKYTDQLSQALISEAVLQGTTFKYISLLPGVPHATAINLMTSNLVAQAGGCGISNPTGSVVPQQRTLQVCPLKVEENICEDDLKQYWLGKLIQDGSYVEELSPRQFAQVYSADKVNKLGALIEDYYWKGSSTGTYSSSLTLCNGLLHLLDFTSASASVVSGNGTFSAGTTMTVANAIAIVDSMITAMNTNVSDILGTGDLTLFMSYSNFNLLITALRNINYFHSTTGQESVGNGRWEFMFPGQPVRIVATRGLNGTNRMILTTAKNLYYGFDAESDYTKFRIWYEQMYDDIRFRAKFKIGAQIAYPQYIVYFK